MFLDLLLTLQDGWGRGIIETTGCSFDFLFNLVFFKDFVTMCLCISVTIFKSCGASCPVSHDGYHGRMTGVAA
jgi:hypothetical protein